jgi:hypothetical protein
MSENLRIASSNNVIAFDLVECSEWPLRLLIFVLLLTSSRVAARYLQKLLRVVLLSRAGRKSRWRAAEPEFVFEFDPICG